MDGGATKTVFPAGGAFFGEIDVLRKMLDRPSPDLIEMKVEYECVKEQLEEKNSSVGRKFADIELESLEGLSDSFWF